MNKQYYLIVIDILMMFVVILIITMMSVAFENKGKSNTNYNAISLVEKAEEKKKRDLRNHLNYIAVKLSSDKISVYSVNEKYTKFIDNYYDTNTFSSSDEFDRNVNFVIFDDGQSEFLGELVRSFSQSEKMISIAK